MIRRSAIFKVLALLAGTVLVLTGCVSATKMLERAEGAWAAGMYADSISMALSSYDKAVDRNKDPAEISSAKSFLENRFPKANEYLLERAESQLNGSDTEKSEAWKTFQVMVNMNRRVRDSRASAFLVTEDYSERLSKAKNVAAQIIYVKALELIGKDRRDSYIEAYRLLGEIDGFVPDYRDIRNLAELCREEGTLLVAFSDRVLPMSSSGGDIQSYQGISGDVQQELRRYIESNDYPDFLDFTSAGSIKGAQDAGAVLFIDIQGDIQVSSETSDDYANNGTIIWQRSYRSSPTLIVSRIADSRTETASADLYLDQEITIEFFPKKYSTTELTTDMYTQKFNNASWMASQLSSAQSALGKAEGRADMVVWAEMEYGGVSSFLNSAEVTGEEGLIEVPVEEAVWRNTAIFINQTLPAFLNFSDLNLSGRIADEIASDFLSSSKIRELLTDLED